MRTLLVYSRVVYALSLLPWMLMILLLPMAYVAGFDFWNIILGAFLLVYPVVAIMTIVLSTSAYKGSNSKLHWACLSPFFLIIVFSAIVFIHHFVIAQVS